jgi:hippurate hydrolase
MVLDESVMARGAAVHAALAERFLADGFETPSDNRTAA